MSDPTPDELASAYVDGEVTAEERARVEADPGLLARAAELRAARDFVRDAPVEAPTASRRDAAIAAAAAELNVVALRTGRARRGLRVASIAAAVVVVLGALGLLLSSLSSSDESVKSTAAGAGSSAPLATTTAPPPLAQDATAAAQPSASVASLGAFADENALVDGVRSAIGQRDTFNDRAAEGAATFSTARCAPPVPPGLTLVFDAAATLAGRAVQVDVYADASGARTLAVTDASTCQPVFTRSL
jgi:hypothetical protein